MSSSPERKILTAQANETPFRLRSVDAKPFSENGFFGFTFTYDDHIDEKERAVTLFCGPEELEDLARLAQDGLTWFSDEEAQTESEQLQRETMEREKTRLRIQ
jgi:hypothetical protein